MTKPDAEGQLRVALIGGGMIAHDQILPSLYQLQRLGLVGGIAVCARRAGTLDALAANETIRRAFPGHSFLRALEPYPELLAKLPPRSIAIVALPDHIHYEAILTALQANHHVLVVKPLVLKAAESVEIEREARARGLVVGIEYHKRFDDRSLMARMRYREGKFGELKLGTACLLEKWNYRGSNFQNWCTTENSDAFTYIGCHYVDLVAFITGLKPVSVSVYGVRDRFPNGNEGFLWTDARVIWSNGGCLNVQNALGFPDGAPGSNTQGITMYCSGSNGGAWLAHSDQYRGLQYAYVDGAYSEPSPDYFQYVDLGGPGLVPVGYGYRSIYRIVEACLRVESAPPGVRLEALEDLDRRGIIATPGNSRYNELVIEAGRLSIFNSGREAVIDYDANSVSLR
jgi:D-galacturonate reductase